MKNPFNRSWKNWKIAGSLWLAGLFIVSMVQAQTNVAVGIPNGTVRSDNYPMAGYGFCAPSGGSATVNALGYWDANGTGLSSSHVVALYGYNGSGYSLIVSATVPAGTFAPLVNGYRWVAIPTTTLPDNGQGGNYYTVQATHGGDAWTTGIGGSPVLDPSFGTYSGQCYGSSAETAGDASWSVVYGDSNGDGSTGFGGPNFGYFNPALPSLDLPILVTNIQSSASGATVGDTAVFTAAFSNSPPVNLQWRVVANGVTNDINGGVINVTNNGVVISTLTIANLQTTNSGFYQVEAVNATDSSAYIYSASASLTISALIHWTQTGTFNDNSVLALAGPAAQEVYGVDFGGSDAQVTGNGYAFDDYQTTGNMSLALLGGDYNNYLGGGGTTGDGALDFLLSSGIYNDASGGIPGTLNNLTVGQTYTVIALLADTRTGVGTQTPNAGFYGSDGVLQGPRQPFVFPAAVPAVGAYAMGTFTAVSTNEPLSLVTEYSGGSFGYYGNCQYNAILLVTSIPPVLPPIYLAQDTVPAPALAAENQAIAFTAAFRNIPVLNLQWQVITTNGVTNIINIGIVNVTNNNNSVVTSMLSLSNLQLSTTGNSYQLKAVNATNSSDVAYSTAVQLTVSPAITWIAQGTFTNNSVLALAGSVGDEVYGVDFGGSDAQTTANGYTFDDYQNTGNFSVAGSLGSYGAYMTGGATTSDAALDALLTFGDYGSAANTGTLNNLTVGQRYNVLAILDDTRGSAAGGSIFAVSDGVTTSPTQLYAFANGSPSVGGYILGTFTAAATTQTYTVFNNPSYNTQYNAILLATAPPLPPVLAAPRIFGGNLILTGSGGPPNAGYTWLQTTSLNAPITWTTNSIGTLDSLGGFSNSIPITPSVPASYFKLRMP